MAVDQEHAFARKDVFPSWFANAIQKFLTGAETSLVLSRKSATVIQVVPETAREVAVVAIEGRWRWNEATVERTVSGAKGTYAVWAVAEDNDIDNSPDPFTDHTVYAWDLRITSGAAPTGEGIDIVEKIGEVGWSGSEIEWIKQTHNAVHGAQITSGALSGNGDITWTQEASGAWVPQLKSGSVGSAEIENGSVADTDLASPNNGVWRTIAQADGPVPAAQAAGTYLLNHSGLVASGSNMNSRGLMTFPVKAVADYAVAGKTTQVRVIASLIVNGASVAPTFQFKVGVHAFTGGGAAVGGELKATFGSRLYGPATFESPAGSATLGAVGSTATFSSIGSGVLCFCLELNEAMPAGGAAHIGAQLQMRHT